MLPEKLILTLVPHARFGQVLQAVFASWSEKMELFTVIEPARSSSAAYNKLNSAEKQVVTLVEKYSDTMLMKTYSREKKPDDFIRKVDDETVQIYIRPFIEARHREIVALAKSADIPLFIREKSMNRDFPLSKRVRILPTTSRMVFYFSYKENFTYKAVVKNEQEIVQLYNLKLYTLCHSPAIVLIDNYLHEFEDVDAKKLLPFFSKQHIEVPQRSVAEYIRKFVVKCVKEYDVIAEGFDVSEISYQPVAQLYLGTSLKGEPALHLKFKYGKKTFEIDAPYGKNVELVDKNDIPAIHYFYRNKEWEEGYVKILENSGLSRKETYHYTLNFEKSDTENPYGIVEWINQNQELLSHFELKQNIGKQHYFTGEITLTLEVGKHRDWFDVHSTVFFDEFKIPFVQLKNHILNRIREYVLPDGSIAVLPLEWFLRYEELFRFGKSSGNSIKLKPHHFRVIELAKKGVINAEWQDKNLSSEIPKTLHATLRSYQKDGFKWLVQLQNQKFGGCLADDMGLGKTVQTIALLLHNYPESRRNSSADIPLKETKPLQLSLFDETENQRVENDSLQLNFAPPSLVVMPTSLIFNWQHELKKFAPTLHVYTHTGSDRADAVSFEKKTASYDIVLTTYGIVRQDIHFLSKQNFHYLVLDESQNIKNPASQTFQSIKQLQSNYKLSLTGTPVENSLSDLWAQMDFLNDGILGSLSGFQHRFKEADVINVEGTKQTLLKIINPFILRRLKESVVKELPPLTQEIRYCEMSSEQAEIYNEEKNKARNALLEVKSDKPVQISVLAALTKLRLIANHPVISQPDFSGTSGKFEQIIETAETLIAEGHKVLIFSSFVKHLRLVADYFDAQNWKYAWLTGSTTNRETEIERFNQNKDIGVFFISLKAGGTGLNLTTADYVFILDPWWNPAAEMQAVSRAHRIGQNKKVTLYRFITKNTVEEKIHQLQQNKTELTATIIEHKWTEEEIKRLIEE